MHVNLDAFTHQLADLIGRFADLGPKLGEAARELQDGGEPPTDALVDALAAARIEFVELRAEIVLAAETLGVAVPDVVESATSLEPMLTAMATALDVQRRQAALEEERDRVVMVLDRVDGIGHQDDDNFGPLVTVKLKAAELKAAVLAATNAEEAHSLASRVQPFADLLTMLESTEVLDDQKFSSLEDSVARAFGRQITVAVARRRLLLPGQTRTPQPKRATPEPPAPEPELAAPEPVRLADAMRVPEPLPIPEPEPIVQAPPPQPSPPPETIDRRPPPAYEPPPTYEPAPEPVREREPIVAAAATPAAQQTAASIADASGTDQTAQWWLAAWARWSGWKSTLAFPEATREELAKYPYLLSVPIQQSPDFEEGLLAYGYSIILEHVEKQKPGCIGNALNSLKTGQMKPVGTQLYEYLVSEGRLTETYPDFVTNVLKAAVPEPGPWVQARMIHSKDDTRIFQRPTSRLGETEQTAQRFLADNQRFKEHAFTGTLEPLTTRFFLVQAELRDAHGVEAKLTVDGAASDTGLVATVSAPGKATKIAVRRFVPDGTPVPAIGRDYSAIWFAVFNADPARKTDFRLGLTLRKDTRGMRK
jgi:outer membrane biosynthesis protein TonB